MLCSSGTEDKTRGFVVELIVMFDSLFYNKDTVGTLKTFIQS